MTILSENKRIKNKSKQYVRKTKNPKKCLMCGKSFYGYWNKIYCGNATRGKKLYGCAYLRDRKSSAKSHNNWVKSFAYKEWYEKYKMSGNKKIKDRKAKKTYYSKNREEILKKRRIKRVN